ncbi:MAG: hypothetical protein KA314_13925 [Chloroflexi bacterium]|nr:hypothetical protein [Chloroflexota bacterium]MBP8056932.1 hypothetical protein [Chloroflexota bacterium]
MNRREFLVISGAAALIGMLGIPATPAAAATGSRPVYRGTPDGKLFESTDGGKTWVLITDFTSVYAVESAVIETDGRLAAQLVYWGFGFTLYTKDKSTWLTS